jgi:hypothetical protein
LLNPPAGLVPADVSARVAVAECLAAPIEL